jgi:peptidyl-prolyl cis-trans isomerase A (cyclophilin A)
MRNLVLLAVLGACGPKQGPAATPTAPTLVPNGIERPAICASPVTAAGPVEKEHRAALARGLTALQEMDLPTARATLAEAGDHPAAQSARAITSLQEGRSTEAREQLRDLTTAWPTDGCLKQAAAYAALTDGQIPYGAALAEEARKLSPDLPAVMILHGFTQMMTGDVDGAADTWRAVLAVAPMDPVANAALAAHYLRLGDALLALPLLEKAGEAGVDVGPMLPVAYYRAGELGKYLQVTSAQGWPLGDGGKLATSADPMADFRALLGIEGAQTLWVTLQTSMGPLECELFWDKAPVTVGNFVGLARGTQPWVDPRTGTPGSGPYYDGTVLHRVIPDFMIQMGDPTGTGTGDPGYRFADEIAPDLRFDRPGLLAMANGGPGTNGAQFFVTEVPTPHLSGRHTIFGACDEASLARVKEIARVPRDGMDKPMTPVVLESVTIEAR